MRLEITTRSGTHRFAEAEFDNPEPYSGKLAQPRPITKAESSVLRRIFHMASGRVTSLTRGKPQRAARNASSVEIPQRRRLPLFGTRQPTARRPAKCAPKIRGRFARMLPIWPLPKASKASPSRPLIEEISDRNSSETFIQPRLTVGGEKALVSKAATSKCLLARGELMRTVRMRCVQAVNGW